MVGRDEIGRKAVGIVSMGWQVEIGSVRRQAGIGLPGQQAGIGLE